MMMRKFLFLSLPVLFLACNEPDVIDDSKELKVNVILNFSLPGFVSVADGGRLNEVDWNHTIGGTDTLFLTNTETGEVISEVIEVEDLLSFEAQIAPGTYDVRFDVDVDSASDFLPIKFDQKDVEFLSSASKEFTVDTEYGLIVIDDEYVSDSPSPGVVLGGEVFSITQKVDTLYFKYVQGGGNAILSIKENVYNGIIVDTIAVAAKTLHPIILIDNQISGGRILIDANQIEFTEADSTKIGFQVPECVEESLSGTFDFSTDPWCNDNLVTGSVAIEEKYPGYYATADFSFGAYDACYGTGATVPAGTLTLKNECGKLKFIGKDQWGDVYTINSVVVNGSDLTIDWQNTYGENGVTTLSRTDGTNWPDLTN